MSKSGRWVASPTAQGAPQPHNFFGRPSKATANSPLAAQDASNQAYQQSNGQAPISASWSNPPAAPNGPRGTSQQASNTGSMPSAASSAPLAPSQPQGRWQGFAQMFTPRPRRNGSGALLDHPDPAILSSIAESDPETGVVDASLHAYHSTDLDASNAASAASKLWAISAPSLSPRRGASASPGSDDQPGHSQGSYVVPSPWSTPSKQPSSALATLGAYPVPSPQNTPLGSPPQSRTQSPSAAIGPFEAAARARAAQARASGSSPGDSIGQNSPAQAAYPVPSPPTANGGQQQQPNSNTVSPAASMNASQSRSSPSRAGQAGPSPARDWSTGIAGMGTTRAARSSPSNTASRRRRL